MIIIITETIAFSLYKSLSSVTYINIFLSEQLHEIDILLLSLHPFTDKEQRHRKVRQFSQGLKASEQGTQFLALSTTVLPT